MNISSENGCRASHFETAPSAVEVLRDEGVGRIRVSGVCTRHNEHGFEAELPGATMCVGEEVEAQFLLGLKEPIRASARVIYRNQNRYGLFFRDGFRLPPNHIWESTE